MAAGNSQTLEKELEPIRYVSESDAPSGRDGSSARGSFPGPSRDVGSARPATGPNGEKGLRISQDWRQAGKSRKAGASALCLVDGFMLVSLTNESIEFRRTQLSGFLNNGKDCYGRNIWRPLAVNVDGLFQSSH